MIEPEKPKKAAPFPYKQAGFSKSTTRIKLLRRQQSPIPYKGRKTRLRKRVARVLKLIDDKDDLKTGKPAEAEVIEAPLTKKRTLQKAADAAVREAVAWTSYGLEIIPFSYAPKPNHLVQR